MNNLPPDDEDLSDIDALYRRVAAADASVPDEKVRERVHAYAKQLALRTQFEATEKPAYSWHRPQRRPWRRPAAIGALAATLLAVFMWIPRTSPPSRAYAPPPQARVTATPRDDSPGDGSPVFADISPASPALADRDARAPAPARVAAADAAPRPPPVAVAQNPRTAAAATGKSADAAAAGALIGGMQTARTAAGAASRALDSSNAAAPSLSAPTAVGTGEVSGAALWRAAESGDLAALRGLRERHADLDVQDGAGRTAVMLATLHGHSQAVALLLDAGANPNIQDHSGESPLDAALAADESEIITALKRHGGR